MGKQQVPGGKKSSPRKTHTKSRLGCRDCKRRRIKCDEEKPTCSNCVSYGVTCIYAPRSTSHNSAKLSNTNPEPSSNSAAEPVALEHRCRFIPSRYQAYLGSASHTLRSKPHSPGVCVSIPLVHQPSVPLNVPDLELWHHFMTSTCWTFMQSDQSDSEVNWLVNIPRMGFAQPFLMDLFLALSAVHVARQRQDLNQCHHATKGDRYYGRALKGVAAQLCNLTHENCEAFYLASVLLCFYSLGRGPQPEEYLAFSSNGQAEWLKLLRGVRSIVMVMQSTLSANALARPDREDPLLVSSKSSEYRQYINLLRSFILEAKSEDQNRQMYLKALDSIAKSFAALHEGFRGEDEDSRNAHLIFGWLFNLPEELVRHLEQKRPIPLIIFAYFIVLMKDLETFWVMHGWSQHVMSGIYTFLDHGYRAWIQWPMEKVGWDPNHG